MGMTGLLCNLVGTVYPAYASFKAIESPGTEDDQQWLTYWVMHATVLLAEQWCGWLFMWFPFYYQIKLLIILWAIAPQTQGAKKVYEEVVKPFLVSHAGKIDPVFKGTEAVINLNLTNKVAHLVESHGPAAAESVTNLVFNQDNMAKLSKLAQTDPKLVERVFRMAVDTVSSQAVAARA